jgi:hypothetical protein
VARNFINAPQRFDPWRQHDKQQQSIGDAAEMRSRHPASERDVSHGSGDVGRQSTKDIECQRALPDISPTVACASVNRPRAWGDW